MRSWGIIAAIAVAYCRTGGILPPDISGAILPYRRHPAAGHLRRQDTADTYGILHPPLAGMPRPTSAGVNC